NPFPPEFFGRIDDSDDELFYRAPRLVVHIDDGAIAKAGQISSPPARVIGPRTGKISALDAGAESSYTS
ncbi:MAG TPA: hypothetical protein VNF29_01560, partial [Candidatus Binataceae bacterium]|nr:hypothetical protein [Candidatus Binataceae bacterium]